MFVETITATDSPDLTQDPLDAAAAHYREGETTKILLPTSSPDVLELCITHSAAEGMAAMPNADDAGLLGSAGALASGSWSWVKSGTTMVLSKVPTKSAVGNDGTTKQSDTIELPRPDFILRSSGEISFAVRGLLIVHIVGEAIFMLLSVASATGTPLQSSHRERWVPMLLSLSVVVEALCGVLTVILFFAGTHLVDVPDLLSRFLFTHGVIVDVSDDVGARWGNQTLLNTSIPLLLGDYSCEGDCCPVLLQLHDAVQSLNPWIKRLIIFEIIVAISYVVTFIILRYDPFGRDAEMTPDTYYRTWLRRLEVGCCCLNDGTEQRHRIFSEIAFSATSLFQNHDLSPVDMVAATALLWRHHKGILSQRRKDRNVLPIALQLPQHIVENSASFTKFHLHEANELLLLSRFARHSSAVYGWSDLMMREGCCVGCRQLSRKAKELKTDESIAQRHIGDTRGWNYASLLFTLPDVASEDFLFSHWSTDVLLPSFYVCIDRSQNCIVIAVRGTNSLYDFFTDAVASSVELDEEVIFTLHSELERIDGSTHKAPEELELYRVHAGMQESAENIFQVLRREGVLGRLFGDSASAKSLPIVVLGHSLGAGVAILLTTLIFAKHHFDLRPSALGSPHQCSGRPDREIRCLAYAAPGALLSEFAAKLVQPLVTACCLSEDVVPRISPNSLARCRASLCYCLAASPENKSEVIDRCAQRCCCGIGPFEHLWEESGILSQDITVDQEVFVTLHSLLTESVKLHISNLIPLHGPPRNFLVERLSEGADDSAAIAWPLHRSGNSRALDDIVLSPNMFRHHSASLLEKSLRHAKLPLEFSTLDIFSEGLALSYRPLVNITTNADSIA